MTKHTARALAFALVCAAPAALALTPAVARAQSVGPINRPASLSLNAQASADVPQDVVDITLFYEQEASDPSALTSTLNQRADSALQKSKGVSGVTARTGSFSIYPSTDRDGRISAWRGRTEIVLESHDFTAASKLAGQMASIMQVGNVQFSLSPAAQRVAEQKLTRRGDQVVPRAGGIVRAGVRLQRLFDPRGQRRAQRLDAAAGHDDERARQWARTRMMAAPVPIEGGTSTVTVECVGLGADEVNTLALRQMFGQTKTPRACTASRGVLLSIARKRQRAPRVTATRAPLRRGRADTTIPASRCPRESSAAKAIGPSRDPSREDRGSRRARVAEFTVKRAGHSRSGTRRKSRPSASACARRRTVTKNSADAFERDLVAALTDDAAACDIARTLRSDAIARRVADARRATRRRRARRRERASPTARTGRSRAPTTRR